MEEQPHSPERDESARIHHPHDKLAKHAFSDIPTAVAFFRSYLPQRIVKLLDFDKLTLVPGSYIDEAYRQTESDLLYSVPYKSDQEESLYLYLLFEHLSSQDWWAVLNLLSYGISIWKDERRKHPNARKLPLIIPIVLVQSDKPWKAPTSFHDLIQLPSSRHKELLRYVPDFNLKLVELINLPFDQVLGTPLGILTMRTLKAYSIQQLLSDPVWDEEKMSQVPEGSLHMILHYILYAQEVDRTTFQDRLKRIQHPQVQHKTMTIAEYLKQEGREEGRIQSQQTTLQNLLAHKFGELDFHVIERIQSASSEQLEQWTYRLLDARTLEEVWE